MPPLAYKRILLKLSGESLAGESSAGLDNEVISHFAEEIVDISKTGTEIGIVVGGGNIFRGKYASEAGMDRVSSDHMGMLATIINALAMQDALRQKGADVRVMSAIKMEKIADTYIRRHAVEYLEDGEILIFAGGTGNPYFTTDTAAALRAVEIEADVVLKATKVDGVYDCDPVVNPEAKIYHELTYAKVLHDDLKVMDATSVALCRENNIPLVVFNIRKEGNIKGIIKGENIGTIIS